MLGLSATVKLDFAVAGSLARSLKRKKVDSLASLLQRAWIIVDTYTYGLSPAASPFVVVIAAISVFSSAERAPPVAAILTDVQFGFGAAAVVALVVILVTSGANATVHRLARAAWGGMAALKGERKRF